MNTRALDIGLLLLRVGAATLLWRFHMVPKLSHFSEELRSFPDPLGVGHAASFTMALMAEGACSLLVGAGLLARIASLPIILTMMMVVALSVGGFEAADLQSALLYALPYGTLLLTGPGRWSLDHRLGVHYQRRLARVDGVGRRLRIEG